MEEKKEIDKSSKGGKMAHLLKKGAALETVVKNADSETISNLQENVKKEEEKAENTKTSSSSEGASNNQIIEKEKENESIQPILIKIPKKTEYSRSLESTINSEFDFTVSSKFTNYLYKENNDKIKMAGDILDIDAIKLLNNIVAIWLDKNYKEIKEIGIRRLQDE